MDFVESFFKEDSQQIFINASTRSLQVCLHSVQPELKLVIKLTAHEHRCHVDFTFESWLKILEKCQKILESMREENEEVIFVTDQLKVFTEMRHGQCAVCFMDSNTQRVNVQIKTFKKLLQISDEISSIYLKYHKKIKTKAQTLESFIEFIVQHSCDNRQQVELPFTDILHKLKNMPDLSSRNVNYSVYDDSDYEHSDSSYY